jgi:hypothetical protein
MPDTMNGLIIHSVGDRWEALSPTGLGKAEAK